MKAVCATDLSAASQAAIQNETCLACLTRIGIEDIHLVTVVPANVHAGMPGIDFERRRRRALARYRDVMEGAGFDVEIHVVRGTPHRRIRGIGETIGADLTIVGSRGESPLENRFIGSTARNLARTTVTPLLVHRIERGVADPAVLEEHLFTHVLFATDFSRNADRAFEAFSFLRHATETVTIVHVETPKDPGVSEDAESHFEELTDRLAEWGIDSRTEVRQGDPAREILDAEEAHSPTMILMGSRGHSRLRRLLIGSVSERVVARARGNVMLVPPRDLL